MPLHINGQVTLGEIGPQHAGLGLRRAEAMLMAAQRLLGPQIQAHIGADPVPHDTEEGVADLSFNPQAAAPQAGDGISGTGPGDGTSGTGPGDGTSAGGADAAGAGTAADIEIS